MNKRRSHCKNFSTWYYYPKQQLGPQCDAAYSHKAYRGHLGGSSPTPPEALPTAHHDCMVKDRKIAQDDLFDPKHAR